MEDNRRFVMHMQTLISVFKDSRDARKAVERDSPAPPSSKAPPRKS